MLRVFRPFLAAGLVGWLIIHRLARKRPAADLRGVPDTDRDKR
jgi:hypothetical protein